MDVVNMPAIYEHLFFRHARVFSGYGKLVNIHCRLKVKSKGITLT